MDHCEVRRQESGSGEINNFERLVFGRRHQKRVRWDQLPTSIETLAIKTVCLVKQQMENLWRE